uniref:HAUS augmin-like complex subunit 2-like protein n=1 Tax=Callorhinchus milii TaxID=7868 RepID=V9KYU2_CALMI|eukprot:gi/632975443/ref/XP_007904232.1/ PREDICTED: HAUS augmin-like complex subunit 2 [Callorhinchus milii]
MEAVNPWAPGAQNPAAAFLQRSLTSGTLSQSALAVSHGDCEGSVPFVQRFRFMDAASSTRARIEQMSLETQVLELQEATALITHPSCLTMKRDELQRMNRHLEAVLRQEVELRQRLVRPLCGQSLPVEAPYHRYVVEILPMMTSVIEEVESHLKALSMASQIQQKTEHVEGLATSEVSVLLEVKALADLVLKWRAQQKMVPSAE